MIGFQTHPDFEDWEGGALFASAASRVVVESKNHGFYGVLKSSNARLGPIFLLFVGLLKAF